MISVDKMAVIKKQYTILRLLPYLQYHNITSHHMEKSKVGLNDLYIREITLKYNYMT